MKNNYIKKFDSFKSLNEDSQSDKDEPRTMFLTPKEFQEYLSARKGDRGNRGKFYCSKCGELTSGSDKSGTASASIVHLLCADCNGDRLSF